MQIETALDQFDFGAMTLPDFQGGHVWNHEQVRGLTRSAYSKFSVDSLPEVDMLRAITLDAE